MQDQDFIALVMANLGFEDNTHKLMIEDMMQEVKNYCNLQELPASLEPFVRKKAKGIIAYEKDNGTDAVFDVKSIKEGDTSITYNVDDKTSKETVYGLTDRDKHILNEFRRLRR